MNVGVIGSGSIGPDLAYGFVSALAGAGAGRVHLLDIRKEALDAGVERIRGYVGKGVARGRLSPKLAEAIQKALVPTLNIADLAGCDYVLEAATEDLATKRLILKSVEQVVRPDCLVGFATSGIPRARIAAGALHPERCFVNHPFFPAWRSLPMEVVLSGDEAFGARMIDTLVQLGKVPIITADVPCFAADDIFCNYVTEAARIVEEGVATPAQVDRIVNDAVGGGGPFNVMDLTRGNLLTVHCQELMREAPTGSEWFAPPAILAKQGSAPWFDASTHAESGYTPALAAQVMDRILAVLFARTCFVVDHGICDASDLNWLTRNALGFADGLLDLAVKTGARRAHDVCARYAKEHRGFEVPPSIEAERLPTFFGDLKVTRDGEIAIVTIRRPEVKNALSARTMTELAAAVGTLGADASVQGIVITGFGGALAGADINELASLATPEECEAKCRVGHAVLDGIARLAKPVVAAVNGPVLGGGAELAMACHARVVGPALVLGQPEVNLGIIPGYGGTQRLPRLIGVARALDLLRTGRTIGAKEACQWGWAWGEPASDVVKAAADLARAHVRGDVALQPVDASPAAVPEALPAVNLGHRSLAIDAILVDVVRRGVSRALDEGLRVEAKGFAACKLTVDMDVGMRNFIQNGPRVPAVFLHE
jgi:enoyl-CoA hydratase/3-hydroxyacyl-CoA dehydrogenase